MLWEGGGGVDGEEGGWRRGKREGGGGVSACGDLDLFGVLGVWEVFGSFSGLKKGSGF